MKVWTFLILAMALAFPLKVMAQASPTSGENTVRHGCRVIDVHCKCTHPTKDFVVEGQKLGRANPGEPGGCMTKSEIDATADKMPIAYCLRGQSVKDVRQGESKCTATWICKEPCTIPSS